MPVRNKIRIYETAIWGSIIVCLGLCSLGGYLTYKQYRDMGVLLFVSERSYSSTLASQLRSHLRKREKDAFQSIEAFALGDAKNPPPSPGTPESFFELPFRIRTNGEIEGLDQPARTTPFPSSDNGVPPAEYRQAVRLSHSQAPLARKVRSLEAASSRPSLPEAWRIRARTQLAALYNRHDQPAAAESIYAGLLKNAPGSLAYIAWPTPAQLSLAMAETLSIQGRKKAVQEVLTRGLSFIDSGPQKNGFVRRESYLQGSMQLLQDLGLSPTRELNEALQKLEARKPIQLAVKHVRDVSLPRAMAARDDLSSPRWSWRGIGSKVGVAWKPTPAVIDTAGVKGAGMIVNVERLLIDLNNELLRLGESGSRQVVLLDPARKDSMITYASLDGNFGWFAIGQTKEEWEKRLGAARRPFAIAGLLSGILGLTLVAGLLVLRKAMRKEMNLSRMKTEFVANVSHELKTPLSLIKLCSETLQFDRVQGEEKRQEYFEVINRESDRLGHLIGNVLNFSRIDAGKKNYDLKKTDLAPVLNQTLDAYFLQITEQDLSCTRDIPASLPAVLADEEAVAQAFINLLQNAVRYSPEKGDLTVRGWSDGRFLLVSIADNGIGIAEEEQQRIWDDYYRTAEARALGTRGSGLGLSLVSHIMRAHGGETRLRSKPGEGSEFTLAFPLETGTEMESEDDR